MTLTIIPAAPPIRCEAYRLLSEAEAALGYSQYIEAGCYLREGIRQMLAALCQWHDVNLSRRKVRNTVGALIAALRSHGVLDDETADELFNAIAAGNRAAHLAFVTREELSWAIRSTSWILQSLPIGREGGAV